MLAASLTHTITRFVGDHSVAAVFSLMLIDAVFPAASELVMVYAGALAAGALGSSQHVVLFGNRLSSHLDAYLAVALAGTLGYLIGSLLGWGIGASVGRPFVEQHGRLFHLDADKLAQADAWFARRGRLAVLLGRLTPVIRSFVSIPAGLERMALTPYTLLTLAGSAAWCFALAGVGWAAGTGYERFHQAFEYASIGLLVALAVAGGVFILRRRAPATRPSERRPG